MESKDKDNDCTPCGQTAALGVLFNEVCKDQEACKELEDKFFDGKLTLRQVGQELGADQEVMDTLDGLTDLDTTFNPLDFNKEDG